VNQPGGSDGDRPDPPGPEPEEPLTRRQLLVTMLAVYVVMVGAGVAWLAWRQRTAVIGEWAVGRHGSLVAVAAGTGTGLVFFVIGRLLARYATPFAVLDARLSAIIGPVTEHDAVLIAVMSGAAEEFFFRCAVQDALGLLGASLLFALAHFGGRGMLLWSVQAGVLGLVFGGLVHFGFGVLSAALAHAVFNYLWLQRSTS
jgi:membrane protease YdiL (CAAX protease family)